MENFQYKIFVNGLFMATKPTRKSALRFVEEKFLAGSNVSIQRIKGATPLPQANIGFVFKALNQKEA